jgi:hypothetical protein
VRIFSPYHVANRRFARDRQRQGALLYGFGGVGPPQNERVNARSLGGFVDVNNSRCTVVCLFANHVLFIMAWHGIAAQTWQPAQWAEERDGRDMAGLHGPSLPIWELTDSIGHKL